jgi:hypothetical protein
MRSITLTPLVGYSELMEEDMSSWVEAIKQAIEQGGGTFDTTGTELAKSDGYWVGGFQKIINPYAVVPTTPDEMLGISLRISRLVSDICMDMTGDDGIGLWVDKGNLYVDVSRHFTDRTRAIGAGVANDQKAIYDVAAGENIELGSFDVVAEVLAPEKRVHGEKVAFKAGLFVDYPYQSSTHTGCLRADVYEGQTYAATFDRETGGYLLVRASVIKPAYGYERLNEELWPYISPRVTARWGKRERVF